MESEDMLRILTNYLSGKPVSEAELVEAEAQFRTHGGGERLLNLVTQLGEQAAGDPQTGTALNEPTDNVIDLQRIRIRRQNSALTVVEGDATSRVVGWMNIESRAVKLDVALPHNPTNRIEMLIEWVEENVFHLTVLALHGPNQQRCTISVESSGQITSFDANLTRRVSISPGTHTLTITFGGDGVVSTELDVN